MSKESYIGGDYIETTAGSNKTFAKGKIINASLESNFSQNGLKNGVLNGTNRVAPFIEMDTGIGVFVEFEPLSTFDGEFGFDWLRTDSSDNPTKVQTVDITNLEFVYDNSRIEYISVITTPNRKNEIKTEYEKVPLKIPYYSHWLSIRQVNQEIKLNMLCNPIKKGDDITKQEVSFRKNDFYEVTIDGQKNENIKYIPDGKPKEISIKILKTSAQIDIVPLDRDGKEIGKIIAVDNTKIYNLPIRLVCVVKDTATKETEISQLISDFKTEKIEEYLNNNSLNQALIKTTVEIDSKYRIAFDENAWSGKFYDKAGNFFTNRKDPSGAKVKYKNDDGDEIESDYEHILDKFLNDYKDAFEKDGKKFKGILLFITNIKKDPADLEGGVSRTQPVNFREAIIFASNLKDKSSYAHEIAHALGLEHYFWRDPEYKNDLEDIKSNIKSNEEAKKNNENGIKDNKQNIKTNKEAKKHNDNIINERNQEIKKWTTEMTKPTYSYKKEAQERIDYLKAENKKTKDLNDKIEGYIKKSEDSNVELMKTNNNIDKLLEKQKNNLNVYKSNKYKFKEKSTLNIMDYSSKTNIFTKWQWNIMQNDVKFYYGSVTENK